MFTKIKEEIRKRKKYKVKVMLLEAATNIAIKYNLLGAAEANEKFPHAVGIEFWEIAKAKRGSKRYDEIKAILLSLMGEEEK